MEKKKKKSNWIKIFQKLNNPKKYLHVFPLQQSTMSFTQSVWCSIDAIYGSCWNYKINHKSVFSILEDKIRHKYITKIWLCLDSSINVTYFSKVFKFTTEFRVEFHQMIDASLWQM